MPADGCVVPPLNLNPLVPNENPEAGLELKPAGNVEPPSPTDVDDVSVDEVVEVEKPNSGEGCVAAAVLAAKKPALL